MLNGIFDKQQVISKKRSLLSYLLVIACIVSLIIGTTACKSDKSDIIESTFNSTYYSPEAMAVADATTEKYGAEVYFDALKSDNINEQYFAINKLVEYYNDEEIREKAIKSITPFLKSEEQLLSDAAAFALSVLEKTFDDKRIITLADGTLIFTLFNDYSDYGSYNQLWMIRDGELTDYMSFSYPLMYIKQMIPSPDKKLFAVVFCSNKSEFLTIHDIENGVTSAELIDSARVLLSKELNNDFWARLDNENYSYISSEDAAISWTNNSSIKFYANLSYDDGMEKYKTLIHFDFKQKTMKCEIL
jgi:hypothetical protein